LQAAASGLKSLVCAQREGESLLGKRIPAQGRWDKTGVPQAKTEAYVSRFTWDASPLSPAGLPQGHISKPSPSSHVLNPVLGAALQQGRVGPSAAGELAGAASTRATNQEAGECDLGGTHGTRSLARTTRPASPGTLHLEGHTLGPVPIRMG